jgi:hypothetical protein
MSLDLQIADLLRQAKYAKTLSESAALVRQAEELKSRQHEAVYANSWSAEDAVIRDTLVPGFTHELHTASTDWLADLEETADPREASRSMVAEASLWFGRVSDEVKSYGEEYQEQAKNLARRLAGQYGDYADKAEKTFLDEANRLRATAVRNGLVREAGDAGQTPPTAKGPAQKRFETLAEGIVEKEKDGNTKSFDNLADPKKASLDDPDFSQPLNGDDGAADDDDNLSTTGMRRVASHLQQGDDLFAVLAAADGSEVVKGDFGVYHDYGPLGSSRAPAIQELTGTSQDVVPQNDPGLGSADDLTGANATRTGEEDHASKGSFPVSGGKKESSMPRFAACPTCQGHGKVAVREAELPRIEDITKSAVSGLDQIDQVVDPHDNGPAPTPYPADVAFPWTMDPNTLIPAAIEQAEGQIKDRQSLSPLLQQQTRSPAMPSGGAGRANGRSAQRRQAGGRDNSGWIGDNGARGTDYPGEQVGQYPAPSTNEGYQDAAYGYGGDQPPRPNLPYGHQEANDRTNNPDQWQPGQPTQDDNGWRETVNDNPALAAAAAFVEQHRQAYLRNRG